MPWHVPLRMPYPARTSGDLPRARRRNIEWMRRNGLVRDTRSMTRFLRFQTAELAAYAYPDAVGAALDLAVDLMGWFFAFDDQFDCAADDALVRARSADAELRHVLGTPCGRAPVDDLSSCAASFADFWCRSNVGMSQEWGDRAAGHWREYFAAHVEEAFVRAPGRTMTVERYFTLRRKTIGLVPSLDLAESMERHEIPPPVYAAPELVELRRLATEQITCVNDIVSFEKEDTRGDPHNLIILLRSRGRSRDRAIGEVARMADARLELFERRAVELLDGVAPDDPRGHAVTTMRHWLRGSFDWHHTSGRYILANVIVPGAPGYLDDLLGKDN